MWYIAFTLGLFGSLHCIGMCGPLAIAFTKTDSDAKAQSLFSGISYNLGRAITYAILGVFFGLLGSFLILADFQKVISVVLGIVLMVTFVFSVDLDKRINGLPAMKVLYAKIQKFIATFYQQTKKYPPLVLGMVNGLLPCGLVYLALAGALATGGIYTGALFMFLFGLGTLPAMLMLPLGFTFAKPNLRSKFRKVLPYVTLFFGAFLVYRGLVVEMPESLNFWEALKNPIMCH